MNAVHRRMQILEGEVNVEAITAWQALTAEQQAQCRKLALAVIDATRTKDDATSTTILDGWLAERRVNAAVNGKREVFPTLFMFCPIEPLAKDPLINDLERWLAVEPHHFDMRIGAALLLKDSPESEATRRQRLLADRNLEAARKAQADERALQAKERREAEEARRVQLWSNTQPLVRVLLRGHADPATDIIFAALADALLRERARVDEPPPRRAWSALGIVPHPIHDKEE